MGSQPEPEKLVWEKPHKPRNIEQELPHDKEFVPGEAIIGKDKRGQLFVRFPKKISEVLDLKPGNIISFNVETPIPHKKIVKVDKFQCEVIREKKKEGAGR
jgi:hypothetical protein